MQPEPISDAIVKFQNAAFVHAGAREREALRQSKIELDAARAELERVIEASLSK
jgi:hypothetical protein